MRISYILYTLFIYPIRQVIEISYFLTVKMTNSPALAIFGVSMVVFICTLPIYLRAEIWSKKERETQKKLGPKIAKIKTAFKGDEQYMILSTYFRQNHYNPVYALRNSLGVLIQIPFFIAAYTFLSHLEAIQGMPFLFIGDLGKPDGALGSINILPILMTVINIVSGAVYMKGFPVKDKIPLYLMAALFFILLYNSPAGLVLYWTANNMFSLLKNIVEKLREKEGTGKILFLALCAVLVIFDAIATYFGVKFRLARNHIELYILLYAVSLVVFFSSSLIKIAKKILKIFSSLFDDNTLRTNLFFISSITLFVLLGLTIPSTLIAASPDEFSFLAPYKSPLVFVFNSALQSASIFLVWSAIIYFLFSKYFQVSICLIFLCVATLFLCNGFFFAGNYGNISLQLELYFNATMQEIVLNLVISLLLTGLSLFVAVKFAKQTKASLWVIFAAIFGVSVVNITKIQSRFTTYTKDFTVEKSLKYSTTISELPPNYPPPPPPLCPLYLLFQKLKTT